MFYFTQIEKLNLKEHFKMANLMKVWLTSGKDDIQFFQLFKGIIYHENGEIKYKGLFNSD